MTTIEWCDRTWNPTVGCSRVSAGCDHCYAMSVAHRAMQPAHAGLTKLRPKSAQRPGVDWTGVVRLLPERLGEPLRWRKPSRVFVDSMSDLFHPAVPFEFIAAVFGVMAACPRHTFQVLTKRPERAREFFAWMDAHPHGDGGCGGGPGAAMWKSLSECGADLPGMDTDDERLGHAVDRPWPLPNVWLGTSVEDQASADRRIPELLMCPAALRFVSYEPALGFVDFSRWVHIPTVVDPFPLDWIIVGGESGPGARPFDIGWARSVIDQARDTGCKVFVKQLGAQPVEVGSSDGGAAPVQLLDPKGGDPSEWPEDLRVREMPEER